MKHNLKPFDIVLLSSSGFVPKAIQFFTGFEYNHVGILIPYAGELYVVEAKARGFHPTKEVSEWLIEKKEKGNKCFFLRPIENQDEKELYSRFKKLVGAKYEFFNLVFFQLIKLYTRKWIGTKGSDKLICSEAIAWIYKDYFEKPYLVEPRNIAENENFVTVANFN